MTSLRLDGVSPYQEDELETPRLQWRLTQTPYNSFQTPSERKTGGPQALASSQPDPQAYSSFPVRMIWTRLPDAL